MKTSAPALSSLLFEQSPANSAQKAATILMCAPIHYDVEYEINPWMSVENGPDLQMACSEWNTLRSSIERLGARILLIEPGRNLPDMVFSANAGLVLGRSFIPSIFRHKERQGETSFWEAWFSSAGFNVLRLPNGMVFEGAGDALFAGNLLIGGYGFRSDLKAYDAIQNMLLCDVLPVQLVDDRFYHLDTCFCPLDHETAIFFPDAFAPASRADLERRLTCLPVPEEEAVHFACNAIVIDNDIRNPNTGVTQTGTLSLRKGRGYPMWVSPHKFGLIREGEQEDEGDTREVWKTEYVRHKTVILPNGCPKTEQLLLNAGYNAHSVDMSEFLKSGGACKCLTIRVQ